MLASKLVISYLITLEHMARKITHMMTKFMDGSL